MQKAHEWLLRQKMSLSSSFVCGMPSDVDGKLIYKDDRTNSQIAGQIRRIFCTSGREMLSAAGVFRGGGEYSNSHKCVLLGAIHILDRF